MTNKQKAKELLDSGDFTCVLYSENNIFTSKKRGVSPLLERLDSGVDYSLCSAADKVIGRGAAFLYIHLGIKEIFVNVISLPSLELLKAHNVDVQYDECVPAIRNRDNTGFCPIESAVKGIDDVNEALIRIRNKSLQLATNK